LEVHRHDVRVAHQAQRGRLGVAALDPGHQAGAPRRAVGLVDLEIEAAALEVRLQHVAGAHLLAGFHRPVVHALVANELQQELHGLAGQRVRHGGQRYHRFQPARHLATPLDRALAASARITAMLTPQIIEATARACLAMHEKRERYRPLDADVRRAPLDDAYRIQDALRGLLAGAGRGTIAGWKIALTSKAMQQMTGVDQPAAGAIFSSVVHPSPAHIDVRAYHHLGVEFEVAVRLGDALPAGSQPWTRASVADRVAACLPAFELVEDGNADYKQLDAFTLVAQNTWNGGVVLGTSGGDWRGVDLEA